MKSDPVGETNQPSASEPNEIRLLILEVVIDFGMPSRGLSVGYPRESTSRRHEEWTIAHSRGTTLASSDKVCNHEQNLL
ncbi:hypothetical protein C496_19375 [Natronorubrum tibetense GA33]|uniref:Uncharacterized protein n=1 Tax=Natronorubrum tibetense GA33 TaxID=1114856 RepID=L9VKV6_9EURY|nr:hypothetical protein C496_19375 [Natronorubrum tibetense GA33]